MLCVRRNTQNAVINVIITHTGTSASDVSVVKFASIPTRNRATAIIKMIAPRHVLRDVGSRGSVQCSQLFLNCATTHFPINAKRSQKHVSSSSEAVERLLYLSPAVLSVSLLLHRHDRLLQASQNCPRGRAPKRVSPIRRQRPRPHASVVQQSLEHVQLLHCLNHVDQRYLQYKQHITVGCKYHCSYTRATAMFVYYRGYHDEHFGNQKKCIP